MTYPSRPCHCLIRGMEDTVLNPVRLVTPEPLQAHRSCPMCGCSSPQLTSRLPVQPFFEPGPIVDTAAAPSLAFASQTSESQVQTPAHPQKSSVSRSFTAPPSHSQPSASPSPCPPPTSTHSPRKLKRPQTSTDITRKRGSPKKVGSRNGEGNTNASASSVYLPVFPKVEREAKARGRDSAAIYSTICRYVSTSSKGPGSPSHAPRTQARD
ncbi:hypothetical protein F5141DRAFT_361990 [Pisolithus sp. B1]|nr:hypothetical protein F5141DRAFT_361990 [Pisolithus sp. B1]